MKSFYTMKREQAEKQDYRRISGLRYHMVGDMFVAQLYQADVVRVYPNNDIVLWTGGWKTLATQKVMNQVLSGIATVSFTKKGDFLIFPNRRPVFLSEGMVFNAETLKIVHHGSAQKLYDLMNEEIENSINDTTI